VERLTSYTDSWNRQPLPGPLAGGPPPTDPQAAVVSALWLLAAWAPAATPGWLAGIELDAPAQWDAAEPVPDAGPLLAERFSFTDVQSQTLQRYLTSELNSQYVHVRRVPGDDLTLLMRDWRDRTTRLTLQAAASVEPPPEGSRLPCLMTLLSDLLWVNNNNPVTFRVHTGKREEAAGAVSWWARTREDPPEDGDEPRFAPITAGDVRAALLNVARGGLNDLGADWDGDGDYPALPEDHIAALLSHDLLDVLLERVRPVELHGTGFLPVDWDQQDEEPEVGVVVLAGEHEVAVLDIDVSC
jgi:hypothetical protein